MSVVYWRGLTPKYSATPAWQIRTIYENEVGRDIIVATLIQSEQLRQSSFWLGRVSDIEEAP